MPTDDGLSRIPAKGQLILGAAQWGMPYGIASRGAPPSRRELESMIRAAGTKGVRCIDTARDYGESERLIGEQVGLDESWTVITKLSSGICADPGVGDDQVIRAVDKSVEHSLRALRRDRLQVLLVHRGSHLTWRNGLVLSRLVQLREQGRIDVIGMSATDPEDATEGLRVHDIDVIQVAYSAFDRRLQENGYFPEAKRRGKTVVCRSALLQGASLLVDEELPAILYPVGDAGRIVDELASGAGLGRRELLLCFARDTAPGPVVVGCESVDQVAENLRTWELPPLESDLVESMVRGIGQLPESVIDPSRW